jgi:outer membrane lipoprotein-sorting protein
LTKAESIHKSLFPKIELKGREKVGAAEGFVLEATPEHGSAHRFTFDAKTGLLIRETYSINGGEPDHELQYDDYKEVDGIRVPFTYRCSGGDNWTVRLMEVKNNAPIDDAKFDPPSE